MVNLYQIFILLYMKYIENDSLILQCYKINVKKKDWYLH